MLRHVDLVRSDVSEKRVAFIFIAETISELGTTLAITSINANVVFVSSLIIPTLEMEKTRFSETSVVT
jgi:hypothetical protein